MDNVPTSTRKRLAPEPTTAAHKQARVQDPLLSPTMMYGNSITWASSAKDWYHDVSTVMIEGEKCYSFRIEEINKMPLIAAPFSKHPSIRLLAHPIPTTYKSSINMAQAKVLTSFASALSASAGECFTVTQIVQEASHSLSDSDDEQIPDPAIQPAFSNTELAMVQACYQKLHSAFRSAVAYRFSNAAGKMFFYNFAEFILILRPNAQFKPYISTNPHGDCQPGSSTITHTVPKRNTRHTEANDTSSSTTERVADFVVFEHSKNIYTIVGEIKSDDSPAEQQNIEEMLGVWRKNQTAMLGFTCNNESVHLRVLLAEENQLRLYRLPELCLSPAKFKVTLSIVAELFLAFTSFIDTTF